MPQAKSVPAAGVQVGLDHHTLGPERTAQRQCMFWSDQWVILGMHQIVGRRIGAGVQVRRMAGKVIRARGSAEQ